MKRIILTLVIMAGFFITAQAQANRRAVRPSERRMERKIERHRIRRMERRIHRPRHHRMVSNIYTTDMQRSQVILYKVETASTV